MSTWAAAIIRRAALSRHRVRIALLVYHSSMIITITLNINMFAIYSLV